MQKVAVFWDFENTIEKRNSKMSDKHNGQTWALYEKKIDNKVTLFCINITAYTEIFTFGIPVKLSFNIYYNKSKCKSASSTHQDRDIRKIQDIISNYVQLYFMGTHVLSIETRYGREVLFYIMRSDNIDKVCQKIKKDIYTHRIEYKYNDEPNWDTYKKYMML